MGWAGGRSEERATFILAAREHDSGSKLPFGFARDSICTRGFKSRSLVGPKAASLGMTIFAERVPRKRMRGDLHLVWCDESDSVSN